MRLFQPKHINPEHILHNAPGPSPWYLRAFPPKLSNAVFEEAGNDELTAGKIYLKRLDNKVIAMIDMYCYLKPIDDGRLLLWYQRYDKQFGVFGHSRTVDFVILDTNKLLPIEDISSALRRLKNERLYIFRGGKDSKLFSLPTDRDVGEHFIEFPDEFKNFGELLVLGHSTATEFQDDPRTQSLCIFILHPQINRMEIIPQDWFNTGNLDYGYQWVTRVARDPLSRKIFGEGFRISRFVLDDSLRNVEKWFYDDPFYGNLKS